MEIEEVKIIFECFVSSFGAKSVRQFLVQKKTSAYATLKIANLKVGTRN
jgi:hypothetical protein